MRRRIPDRIRISTAEDGSSKPINLLGSGDKVKVRFSEHNARLHDYKVNGATSDGELDLIRDNNKEG